MDKSKDQGDWVVTLYAPQHIDYSDSVDSMRYCFSRLPAHFKVKFYMLDYWDTPDNIEKIVIDSNDETVHIYFGELDE